MFRTVNLPYFFLDLRKAPKSVYSDLWVKSYARYDIGAVYPVPRVNEPIALQWDVVIWVAESTPSHFR